MAGDANDGCPHDHGVQGLIHPAAGFKDRGQDAAGAQFGDLQRQAPHLGGEGAGPIAAAVAEPLLDAFVPVGAEKGGELQLDQLWQSLAGLLRDPFTGAAAIE